MKLRKSLRRHAANFIGWRTSSKYIVFESDDWGSIRMPSQDVFRRLKDSSVDLGRGEGLRYNLTDTLASSDDLYGLFDVLSKYKDYKGNHPVFTALSVVANPDFEAIENNNFETYISQPFLQTLEEYGHFGAYKAWREGMRNNLFHPEFHGREHLNVNTWMRALRDKQKETTLAFYERCWGINNRNDHPLGISYQAAFDLEYHSDLLSQSEIIESGLNLFEQIHGYRSRYFVAPNGPFNNSLESVLLAGGIDYLGASKIQKQPLGEGRFNTVLHWLGQTNRHGQSYITRNAFFEPNAIGKDWLSSCLKDISIAFNWQKPAVISSHRTNYIGTLSKKNSAESLLFLDRLISEILKTWPDVEFITSAELGDKMTP